MVLCCVDGCRNNSNRPGLNVTFHRLPLDEERREHWIMSLKKKNPDWEPVGSAVVCSDHFKPSCFDKGGKFSKRRTLKPDAAPTVFTRTNQRQEEREKEEAYSSAVSICFCGFQTHNRQELQTHAATTKCKIYKCSCCSYVTHLRDLLKYHQETRQYKCDSCRYIASGVVELRKHDKARHQARIKCGMCDCKFTKTKLKAHQKEHRSTTKHPCTYCKHKSSTPKLLRAHIKLKHDKEGEFKCEICDFRSAFRKFLHNHYLTQHSPDETPEEFPIHSCFFCDAKFLANSTLVAHIKNKHADMKTEFYSCQFCDFWGITKSSVDLHTNRNHFDQKVKSWYENNRRNKDIQQKRECEVDEDGISDLSMAGDSLMNPKVEIETFPEDDETVDGALSNELEQGRNHDGHQDTEEVQPNESDGTLTNHPLNDILPDEEMPLAGIDDAFTHGVPDGDDFLE